MEKKAWVIIGVLVVAIAVAALVRFIPSGNGQNQSTYPDTDIGGSLIDSGDVSDLEIDMPPMVFHGGGMPTRNLLDGLLDYHSMGEQITETLIGNLENRIAEVTGDSEAANNIANYLRDSHLNSIMTEEIIRSVVSRYGAAWAPELHVVGAGSLEGSETEQGNPIIEPSLDAPSEIIEPPMAPSYNMPPETAATPTPAPTPAGDSPIRPDIRTQTAIVVGTTFSGGRQILTAMFNVGTRETADLIVSDTTTIRTRTNHPITFGDLQIGQIVDAAFDAYSFEAISISGSVNAWERRSRTNVEINHNAAVINVGTESFSINNRPLVLYQDGFISIDTVHSVGSATLVGIGDTVWFIHLESRGESEVRAALLHIQVSPADAQVFINGALHGNTEPVQVEFGEVLVRVERQGFLPQEQRLVINAPVSTVTFDLVEIVHDSTPLPFPTLPPIG